MIYNINLQLKNAYENLCLSKLVTGMSKLTKSKQPDIKLNKMYPREKH